MPTKQAGRRKPFLIQDNTERSEPKLAAVRVFCRVKTLLSLLSPSPMNNLMSLWFIPSYARRLEAHFDVGDPYRVCAKARWKLSWVIKICQPTQGIVRPVDTRPMRNSKDQRFVPRLSGKACNRNEEATSDEVQVIPIRV